MIGLLHSFIVSDLAPALSCLAFSISDFMSFLDFAEVSSLLEPPWSEQFYLLFFFFFKLVRTAERHKWQPLRVLHY